MVLLIVKQNRARALKIAAQKGEKKGKGVSQSEFGLVRRIRNKAKQAAEAWYNGGYLDIRGTTISANSAAALPSHAEVLAARFLDKYGGINGTLAGCLATVGRADLLCIRTLGDQRTGGTGGGIETSVSKSELNDLKKEMAEMKQEIVTFKAKDTGLYTKLDARVADVVDSLDALSPVILRIKEKIIQQGKDIEAIKLDAKLDREEARKSTDKAMTEAMSANTKAAQLAKKIDAQKLGIGMLRSQYSECAMKIDNVEEWTEKLVRDVNSVQRRALAAAPSSLRAGSTLPPLRPLAGKPQTPDKNKRDRDQISSQMPVPKKQKTTASA